MNPAANDDLRSPETVKSLPPVLLVHGIGDTAKVFNPLAAYLRDLGWHAIHAVNLTPNNGDKGLDELALQIQDYIDTHLPDEAVLDLVGFSMGGIVSRYYVQRLGGAQRVRRFVTLSSPHNGTWTGYFRDNPGVRQMRPASAFLQDLNATLHELEPVEFISLWTPFDLMILPASSSILPMGKSIRLPVLAHPFMLTNYHALVSLTTVLGQAP